MGLLYPRDSCWGWGTSGQNCRHGNSWSNWGRWVAFAVIVGVAILIFFLLACFNARRRRRRGLTPHAGTHWMAPPPGPPPPNQPYWGDPNYSAQPPPQYSPPNQQQFGYFGGQPSGIELQQPPHVYQGGEPYAPPYGPPYAQPYGPPPGPPPGKV